MARYALVYTHPKLGEQRFPLEPHRSYRLGAHRDNDIVVPQKDVSRHHAILTLLDDRFQVTDLDSRNGTFVNGRRTASGEVRCGDQLGLSSAPLLIVDAGPETGEEPSPSGVEPQHEVLLDPVEDTAKYRIGASREDIVALLEATAAALARGAPTTEPLRWAAARLGVEAAAVLYRDDSGHVSVVASAGDLRPILLAHTAVVRVTSEVLDSTPTGTPRLCQLEVLGEQLLLARLGNQHLLVVRHTGHPPAVTDLRAVIAAEQVVLALAESSSAAGRVAAHHDTQGEALLPGCLQDSYRAHPASHQPVQGDMLDLPLAQARAALERLQVERALTAANGSWTVAAARLGITRAGLYKLAKRLGVPG